MPCGLLEEIGLTACVSKPVQSRVALSNSQGISRDGGISTHSTRMHPDARGAYCVTSDEAVALHQAYLVAGVVGPSNENDALHVAIATVENCDIIVSWNFKHIVHFDKIRGYNAVNLREGYSVIAIHSPKEVV
jgi:hypothetical protein